MISRLLIRQLHDETDGLKLFIFSKTNLFQSSIRLLNYRIQKLIKLILDQILSLMILNFIILKNIH